MRIYELLQPQQQQQPGQNDEDDAQGKFDANKVDKNLQDISNQIDYQNAQPEPQAPQQAPPELDDGNTKPIDSSLLSQIKTLPYTKKYRFKDNDPLNPMQFAAKPIEELAQDRERVRLKMQMLSVTDQVGMEDDKDMQLCSDLMQLLNTIMHFKKTNTKSQLAATNSSPPYQTI